VNQQLRLEAHEIAADLAGMVPTQSHGQLHFRQARPGEQPLSGERRRLIGRLVARGVSEPDLLDRLSSWEVILGW